MYIVSPMSNCASPQHRDRFLSLLSAIAKVTEASEPQCLAYIWFRNAEDNDIVPHHWVRGLEVYANLAALTETHRSSAEYKAMRKAVGEEAILERPSDLRFLQPTGIGFLTRDYTQHIEPERENAYISMEEIQPQGIIERDQIMDELGKIAQIASLEKWREISNFWVLERREQYNDPMILVFSRFRAMHVWIAFKDDEQIRKHREEIEERKSWSRNTSWRDTGIGFIRNGVTCASPEQI